MKRIMVLALILVSSACTSIPSEAPKLSSRLGESVERLEVAHTALLHRFFDEKRAEVKSFVLTEWLPVFAESFFSKPKVAAVWNEVVEVGSKPDRLNFIIKVAPALQRAIDEKINSMVSPLTDLEYELESSIRSEYAQARLINESVTDLLLSAAGVEEKREYYVGYVGFQEEDLTDAFSKTDAALASLSTKASGMPDRLKQISSYFEKIDQIKSKFKSGDT